jgi:hypothetical protein
MTTADRLEHQIDNIEARRREIARRYGWHAKRQRNEDKPDKSRLITLIRLRELERVFQYRYGRFLPDDDAGRDDLVLAAHHIVFLRGDVIEHIVGWARVWAPWLPQKQVELLTQRVMAKPQKFTADVLGWRLGLSMADRSALKITTIGASDMSKEERAELRKRKRREAERFRRARKSSGRPRGRPKKLRGHQVTEIVPATDFWSDDSAREVSGVSTSGDASIIQNLAKASTVAKSARFSLEKRRPPGATSTTVRAESSSDNISTQPTPDKIDQAVEIALEMADRRANPGVPTNRLAVKRMLERLWPGYVRDQVRTAVRYYGHFNLDRDLRNWPFVFRHALDREVDAIDRFRARRRKFMQCRPPKGRPERSPERKVHRIKNSTRLYEAT